MIVEGTWTLDEVQSLDGHVQALNQSTRRLEQIHLEHAPTLETIATTDPCGAEIAMHRHLVNTGQLRVRQSTDEQKVPILILQSSGTKSWAESGRLA